jgi:hypothetical protein
LRRRRLFRYKDAGTGEVNAEFTLIRDLWTVARASRQAIAMSTRRDFRAMTREAVQASAGAALILGGLLLLSAP